MPTTEQPDLFTYAEGETAEPEDQDRLATLYERVWAVMADGGWHTLGELSDRCRGSEASVSARLRDMRRLEHGSHRVDRRRTEQPGVFEYRLVLDTPT